MKTETKLTATIAKEYAARILTECSECFTNVRAAKSFGKWVIQINGGSGACYGKTVESVEAAEDTIRIFANEYALYTVTFRGQTLTVQASSYAMAGKLGMEAMGYIPSGVGQHDLTITKL